MKELKSETKAKASQTHTKAKSDFQKSARYEAQEMGYLTPEFQPPQRFTPLLAKLSHPANATLRVQFLTQLQQTYGNRFVQRMLQAKASAAEAQAGGPNTEPQQLEEERPATPGSITEPRHLEEESPPTPGTAETTSAEVEGVRTVLRPDQSPQTTRHVAPPPSATAQLAHMTVAPIGIPTLGTGANDCLPSTAGARLTWTVVSHSLITWRPSVLLLTLAGRIRVNPWPSQPTRMVVPNTVNPVDGGNINNTAGSSNRWSAAIADMQNYDTVGGGAGPHWHATTASSAHEWAHWNQDYIADAVNSARGGNWPAINRAIDNLRQSKWGTFTTAAARAALQPRVNALMSTWRSRTISRWNTLINTTDSPGRGGRGYAAGARVLSGLIARVRAYKTSKGW